MKNIKSLFLSLGFLIFIAHPGTAIASTSFDRLRDEFKNSSVGAKEAFTQSDEWSCEVESAVKYDKRFEDRFMMTNTFELRVKPTRKGFKLSSTEDQEALNYIYGTDFSAMGEIQLKAGGWYGGVVEYLWLVALIPINRRGAIYLRAAGPHQIIGEYSVDDHKDLSPDKYATDTRSVAEPKSLFALKYFYCVPK